MGFIDKIEQNYELMMYRMRLEDKYTSLSTQTIAILMDGSETPYTPVGRRKLQEMARRKVILICPQLAKNGERASNSTEQRQFQLACNLLYK